MMNLILGFFLCVGSVVLIAYLCLKIYMLGVSHANISNAINKGLRDKEIAELLIQIDKEMKKRPNQKSDDNQQGKNPLF